MHTNQITGIVVDSGLKVHSVLGPGLLESAYKTCLAYELRKRGLEVIQELAVPVLYEGVSLDVGYRIDLLVNDVVIVEVKAASAIHPIHEAQLLSYLRLCDKHLGLLINFHELHLRNGIRRLVN